MKKIASILAFIFITITVSAQSLIPIKFGVKFGTNIQILFPLQTKELGILKAHQ
jgi:hypothetical protein